MPRIIAGVLGGRMLRAPRSDRTRPTSDRTREAMFARLEAWGAVEDASVLDLFAGAGTLGFEALSRGASRCCFVERHGPTARLIERSAADLGLSGRVQVRTGTARAAADAAGSLPGAPFDLVFLDPPYAVGTGEVEEILAALTAEGGLAGDPVIVVERSARSETITWPGALSGIDARTHGETAVHYGERRVSA